METSEERVREIAREEARDAVRRALSKMAELKRMGAAPPREEQAGAAPQEEPGKLA